MFKHACGEASRRQGAKVAVDSCRGCVAADCGWTGLVEVPSWSTPPRRARHETAAREEAVPRPRPRRTRIILADFVNHTGDPVFDTTLNQALQIDLEQSPVINIVSQQHLLQSVKYLGKPEGTPVTPAIAREIGEREGIKAIITGTIANLGKEYVITLYRAEHGNRRRNRQRAGPGAG